MPKKTKPDAKRMFFKLLRDFNYPVERARKYGSVSVSLSTAKRWIAEAGGIGTLRPQHVRRPK